MDPCLCTCQSGKCRVHLCLQRQRAYLRQHCPSALNARLKPITKPLTDSNGRFLCPEHKCQFPWSNYLMDQWLQPPGCCGPTANVCGMKHYPPTTKNLPRYFKSPKQENILESFMECDSEGHAVGKGANTGDNLVCQAFKVLKDMRLPIVWVLGHAHCPAQRTRQQFCSDLALALNFLYLNLDWQIRHWTDQLFHKASTEEVLLLPPAVKRLATMCVQLMGDDELHLNLPGILELIKLVMITSYDEARERGCNPQGFIIEDFPVNRKEAEGFGKGIYPVEVVLYFQGKWWSDEEQKRWGEPEVTRPRYFRRDQDYKETEVEQIADLYGGRSVKILNMEEFQDYEAGWLIGKVQEILGKGPPGGSGGGMEEFGGDGGTNYAEEAMRQLAKIYKCQDPRCKCGWSEAGQKEMDGFGGGGNSGNTPIILKCPLERPKKDEVCKEEDKTKEAKVEKVTKPEPEIAQVTEIHEQDKVAIDDSPAPPSTPEENSGPSTPVATTTTASSESGSGKKAKKTKSKDKKGSKKKDKSPHSSDSDKSSKKKKKGKSKSPQSSDSEKSSNKKKKKAKSPQSSDSEKSSKKKGKSPQSSDSEKSSKKNKKKGKSPQSSDSEKSSKKKKKDKSPHSSDSEKSSKKKGKTKKTKSGPPSINSSKNASSTSSPKSSKSKKNTKSKDKLKDKDKTPKNTKSKDKSLKKTNSKSKSPPKSSKSKPKVKPVTVMQALVFNSPLTEKRDSSTSRKTQTRGSNFDPDKLNANFITVGLTPRLRVKDQRDLLQDTGTCTTLDSPPGSPPRTLVKDCAIQCYFDLDN